MKLIVLAAILLPSVLIAQSPQLIRTRPMEPARVGQVLGDALPENYQVSLTIADKDGQPVEVSVVVASTQFSASLGEPGLAFSGTVTIEESGSVIVAYTLGWETPVTTVGNNTQYKPSTTQGSVRLKVGEEIQIIRAGTRTVRLSIKKVEASKPK